MADYRLVVLELSCQGLWAQALVNGAAVIQVDDGTQQVIQTKANPWVIEGANQLQARLGWPRNANGLGQGASYRLRAFEIEHGDAQAIPQPLAEYHWDPANTPLDAPGLEAVFEQTIAPQQTHGRWAWQDAVAYTPADRSQIEATVGQLREQLVNKDLPAVSLAHAVKHEEMARALDVPVASMADDFREGLELVFAASDFSVGPLDPAALVLEPGADGRLVDIYGPQGEAPLRLTADGEQIGVRLTVSQLERGWTIVR